MGRLITRFVGYPPSPPLPEVDEKVVQHAWLVGLRHLFYRVRVSVAYNLLKCHAEVPAMPASRTAARCRGNGL
eukprot:8006962-Heterocapsa_arctica.AAC.1